MAAYVKVIPQKDWEVISKYLNEEGVVLISEEIAKQVGIENLNNKYTEYDFGGEPDIYVDLILSKNHCFLKSLTEEEEAEI